MSKDLQREEERLIEREEDRLIERLERLTVLTTSLIRAVERLQRWHPLLGSFPLLLWRGFLYGIVHGLGYTLGATVIVAVLVWLLGKLEVVPVLGEWIVELIRTIQAAP